MGPQGDRPVSAGQEALWFLTVIDGTAAAYNVARCFAIKAQLDRRLFDTAVASLVEQVAILRSTFPEVQGRPVCRVVSTMPTATHIDAGDWSREKLIAAVRERAALPFDLIEGPVFRIALYHVSELEHYLLVEGHHIVWDLTSIGNVLLELFGHYQRLTRNEELSRAEIPDFLTYVDEERNRPANQALEDKKYWASHLEGELPVVNDHRLPLQGGRPKERSHAGAHVIATIDADLTRRLRELAQRERCTLPIVFLSTYQVLLHRYLDQNDLVVGYIVSNRPKTHAQTVGYFINTLPLRSRTTDNQVFTDFLKQSRGCVLRGLEHRHYPFSSIVGDNLHTRDPARPPIAQVAFAWQSSSHQWSPEFALDIDGATESIAGMTLETVDIRDSSLFDLQLLAAEASDHVVVQLRYNVPLFETSGMARMLENFRELLSCIAREPSIQLGTLPVPGRSDLSLMESWNETARTWAVEPSSQPIASLQCVHHMIEARAAEVPDRVAVVTPAHSMTFAELNMRANKLAHHLIANGARPDALVGVCVERSTDLIIALLAVQKSGAAYVPMDPIYPRERIEHMVKDAACELVVTKGALWDGVESSAKVVHLDRDHGQIADRPTANPTVDVRGENLVYVIYTSGSTGKPKGVQIEHRALINLLLSMKYEPGLDASDTWLSVTTISFDIAALELYLPLIVGARLLVPPPEVIVDGAALLAAIHAHDVTVLQATPSTWRLMLTAGWQRTPKLKALIGGEAVPRPLADQLLERCGEVWNVYGPTETTVWSTCCQIAAAPEPITVGRPIANTSIFVLDGAMRRLPVGSVGDLYIGGDGVARGYRNRPELTAERFVAYPPGAGSRIYKTGDLARLRHDGTIEFLGRSDFQVKIRGFRVELGEVESALLSHPAVSNVVVVARDDVTGESQALYAYYVAKSGSEASEGELRGHLSKTLPDYMVPQRFVAMPALPTTPNGKIDRAALPKPGPGAATSTLDTLDDPRDEIEHTLKGIWERLLQRSPIGINETFLELGGHSLLSVRLVSDIEKAFGCRLPVALILGEGSVERVASFIRNSGKTRPPESPLVALQTVGDALPLFLVHPIGGSVFSYARLGHHLRPNQPLYGMQAMGIWGDGEPVDELCQMARNYVRAVQDVSPRGPYLLGGWSFGGVVAYEMAQQLTAAGEQVSRVVMLDSWAPRQSQPAAASTEVDLLWFARQLIGDQFDESHSEELARQLKQLTHDEQLALVRNEAVEARRLPPDFALPQLHRLLAVFRANVVAVRNYKPSPSRLPLSVLRSVDAHPAGRQRPADPTMGWSSLTSDAVRTEEVPGHHFSMLVEPHVKVVAQALARTISDATKR